MEEVPEHEQQGLQGRRRSFELERCFRKIILIEGPEGPVIFRPGPSVCQETGRAKPGFQLAPLTSGKFSDASESQGSEGLVHLIGNRQVREWQGRQESLPGTWRYQDGTLTAGSHARKGHGILSPPLQCPRQ